MFSIKLIKIKLKEAESPKCSKHLSNSIFYCISQTKKTRDIVITNSQYNQTGSHAGRVSLKADRTTVHDRTVRTVRSVVRSQHANYDRRALVICR